MGFRRLSGQVFLGLSLLLLALPAYAAGDGLAVESIRFGGGGKTRIVIDFNKKPDFRAFLIDNPRRLAVDLPTAAWKIPASGLAGQETVRSYRSGQLEKDGLTRVIFDLRGPAIVTSAFILPKEAMSRDRVVIDLKPASQNLFAAKTAEVYGNRSLKGGVLAPPASQMAASHARDMGRIPLPQQAAPIAVPEKTRAPAAQRQYTPAAPRQYTTAAQRQYTIVIDAGHGGQDPGAQSYGFSEKNITLAMAKELQEQLQETGRYRVVLTRDRDYYIKLHERVDISRKVQGDLFVSVHADKIDRQAMRGASVYTLSENASDAETARLAEDENNAGMVAGVDLKQESQDVADILLDLAMREKMNESNLLAKAVVEGLRRKSVGLLPNSHRSAGFAVLKAPDVPAILIETGFISNPDEAKLLSSAAFQRKMAAAIIDGIDAYFRKMQSLENPR